ncbi:hypothetical protein WA026_016685 [Henosepilachna vigintioctopunctata]|uniref:Uncharacterized protein n=1 Tax=Henosepilachna vigintioctopunctata TaxID=420089 RepID=A0AAW1USF1_9CUCU
MESRLDYRSGGLDFHPPSSMLLENNTNYSHLQKSIDTLRSLGDRLSDRNVDLRLNFHQDLRGYERTNQLNLDRNLELNLSLNGDRYIQERMQQERNLERLLNERNIHDQRNVDHSLSMERLTLERSLTQHMDRALTDKNLNLGGGHDRALMERSLTNDRNLSHQTDNRIPPYHNDRLPPSDRGRLENVDNMRMNPEMGDLKYREYKNHLDNLRMEGSRTQGVEGRLDDDRGTTPTTPPTPLSVGENFHEEKFNFMRMGHLERAEKQVPVSQRTLYNIVCKWATRDAFILSESPSLCPLCFPDSVISPVIKRDYGSTASGTGKCCGKFEALNMTVAGELNERRRPTAADSKSPSERFGCSNDDGLLHSSVLRGSA